MIFSRVVRAPVRWAAWRIAWAAIALTAWAAGAADQAAVDWTVLKGAHFLVHHLGAESFAAQVGRTAEKEYARIAGALGFTRYGDFWLWDRRVKVFVYRERAGFGRATGAPAWAAGKADYVTREITTFEGSEAFLKKVLPHEIAHLVFREFVGFKGEIPLWLDEGVAQWAELPRREDASAGERLATRGAGAMPLAELTGIDRKALDDAGKAAEFYALAASLVGFLIEGHGSTGFRKLCGQLRDGKSMDEALRFTYPEAMRNMAELETAWRAHLERPR